MPIAFGKTAKDYANYRADFPDAFFDRLFADGLVREKDAVLDFGTGSGAIARALNRRGCVVTGLDPSPELLKQARRLDQAQGARIRYVEGHAEDPSLPSDAFDVVIAGRCWHWFARVQAAEQVRRMLRPGSVFIIAHFDWLPLPGNVAEATEQLVLRHNPNWSGAGGNGIYSEWEADMAGAGFENIACLSFDVAVPFSHEAWRGCIRASSGLGASLSPAVVEKCDRALAALLAARFTSAPLSVPHRLWALSARAPL